MRQFVFISADFAAPYSRNCRSLRLLSLATGDGASCPVGMSFIQSPVGDCAKRAGVQGPGHEPRATKPGDSVADLGTQLALAVLGLVVLGGGLGLTFCDLQLYGNDAEDAALARFNEAAKAQLEKGKPITSATSSGERWLLFLEIGIGVFMAVGCMIVLNA